MYTDELDYKLIQFSMYSKLTHIWFVMEKGKTFDSVFLKQIQLSICLFKRNEMQNMQWIETKDYMIEVKNR